MLVFDNLNFNCTSLLFTCRPLFPTHHACVPRETHIAHALPSPTPGNAPATNDAVSSADFEEQLPAVLHAMADGWASHAQQEQGPAQEATPASLALTEAEIDELGSHARAWHERLRARSKGKEEDGFFAFQVFQGPAVHWG